MVIKQTKEFEITQRRHRKLRLDKTEYIAHRKRWNVRLHSSEASEDFDILAEEHPDVPKSKNNESQVVC